MTRVDPPYEGQELESLKGFLDYHRDTLELKCAGLTAEQLARRSSPPSVLSLLGLVRHLAEVERGWFREFASESAPSLYCTDDEPDLDILGAQADDDMVRVAFQDWRAEMVHADEIVARSALSQTYYRDRRGGETISLRWILLHMIEEYARHNGHADFLREAIDGSTGE